MLQQKQLGGIPMSTQVMMVISEAISKGAKPMFTAEGHKWISAYITGKVEVIDAEENQAGA